MAIAVACLACDPARLRAAVAAQAAELAAKDGELRARKLPMGTLKTQLAPLRRARIEPARIADRTVDRVDEPLPWNWIADAD